MGYETCKGCAEIEGGSHTKPPTWAFGELPMGYETCEMTMMMMTMMMMMMMMMRRRMTMIMMVMTMMFDDVLIMLFMIF